MWYAAQSDRIFGEFLPVLRAVNARSVQGHNAYLSMLAWSLSGTSTASQCCSVAVDSKSYLMISAIRASFLSPGV